MTRKVFEVAETGQDTVSPEFELGGEVFVCKSDAEVSSLDVLDYIAGMSDENGLEQLRTVLRMFREFLPTDDGKPEIRDKEDPTKIIDPGAPSTMDRFRDTVRAKRVRLMLLGDISSWVLNEYMRFPTVAASPSSNGSTPAASSSGAVSSPAPGSTSTT